MIENNKIIYLDKIDRLSLVEHWTIKDVLFGKPLSLYTLEQVQQSRIFDTIAVSSDSEDSLELPRKFSISYLPKRPDDLASDIAPKIPAQFGS